MFVYSPTFSTFFKKNKESKYVIAWKSKELFKTKLFPLHGVFLPKAKCERPTMVFMVQKKSNGKQTAEKKFTINFSKAKKKNKVAWFAL